MGLKFSLPQVICVLAGPGWLGHSPVPMRIVQECGTWAARTALRGSGETAQRVRFACEELAAPSFQKNGILQHSSSGVLSCAAAMQQSELWERAASCTTKLWST